MEYPRPLRQEMRYYNEVKARRAVDVARRRIIDLRSVDSDETSYDHTVVGFGAYLRTHKIKHFSAKEAVAPNHVGKANQAGYSVFLPPQFTWPLAALLLIMADDIRRIVGEPVRLRNLWRPYSYNRLVATSGIDSDHPNVAGEDLDFTKIAHRRKAEGYARGLHAAWPDIEVSMGCGFKTLHIGVLSPKGTRTWFYKTLPSSEKKVKL